MSRYIYIDWDGWTKGQIGWDGMGCDRIEWIDVWSDNRGTNGQTDERKGRQADGQIDGQTDKLYRMGWDGIEMEFFILLLLTNHSLYSYAKL